MTPNVGTWPLLWWGRHDLAAHARLSRTALSQTRRDDPNARRQYCQLEFLFHDYESSWQWTRGTYTRSDLKTSTS